ncbi:MAG: FKBP-type peptidyl-prolyl cis-trans isomerase [Clostridia bacterium]|nr:FKBP-type peptidyl-prolyl cis-trans isomerase [Clostridia bacterium]
MKTKTIRLLALVLALVMTLCLFACKDPVKDDPKDEDSKDDPKEDQGTTDTEQTPDPSTDGVFNAKDYDPKKDYQLTKYSELTITDYVTLGKYKNLTLTIQEESITITDELLTNKINSILSEHHPDAKITDRVVAWNDTVIVDYVGKKDGVAFEGGSATNQTIAVEEKNGYIPGFVEGLVGVTPGVATDVPMKFPDDYHAKDLAGQEVVFTFTVHYIVGKPELTDDFVADYTEGEFTTAQAYKENLKAEMEKEAYDAAVRMAFWGKITENAAAKKYPEDAVMYYYSYYYQMYNYYASMYGLTIDIYLMYMGSSIDGLFEACCGVVKEDMVYYAVFAAENYTYTDEQYNRALELYTETNFERLNEITTAAGKEAYTYEEAKEYFNKEEHDLLVLQTLEEIAYNDLIEGYTIVVEPAKDNSQSGSGATGGQ